MKTNYNWLEELIKLADIYNQKIKEEHKKDDSTP